MEYQIFSTTRVITIYRRNMVLLTTKIKKETEKFHLHAQLLDPSEKEDQKRQDQPEEKHQPEKGGFVKASLMLSCEPSNPVQSEAAEEKTCSSDYSVGSKKRISRLFGDESPPVTVNKSYSKPEPKTVTDSTFKATLDDMKTSKATPKDSKAKRAAKSSFSSAKRSLQRQTSIDTFVVSKKRRTDKETNEIDEIEAKAADEVKLKKIDETKPVNDRTKAADEVKKKQMAELVIQCLMPHYKANQIASRDLFKSLARNLSHRILSLDKPVSGKQHLLMSSKDWK